MNQGEKISLRKPSEGFDFPIDSTKSEVNTPKLATNVKVEAEPDNFKDEPMKMFFYYPKYLQPEAVALIAQNMLNEWEKNEK
jgi:hypothetical protein